MESSTPSAGQSERLNVIALISGGKDSFLSLLHCAANGHRVVALANLHPTARPACAGGSPGTADATGCPAMTAITATPGRPIPPRTSANGSGDGATPAAAADAGDQGLDEEPDLNSFMYQTVGHQVVPLYAHATGIPLFRSPIVGTAIQRAREYAHLPGPSADASSSASGNERRDRHPAQQVEAPTCATTGDARPIPRPPSTGQAAARGGEVDETESMLALLQAVTRAHPEANAVSAGAILSTYQRTRVESVATRLGLVPLAYLWKYPVLPLPRPAAGGGGGDDDTQLLRDLGAAGVEARIVKVASGGLDETFLWESVASPPGLARLRRAMSRFGTAEKGAVLGEGGEFETLVVDGPRGLFKNGRIEVRPEDRRVVAEGGGSAWLSIRHASVVPKPGPDDAAPDVGSGHVRVPELLDERFARVLADLSDAERHGTGMADDDQESGRRLRWKSGPQSGRTTQIARPNLSQWCVVADAACRSSIQEETLSLVEAIRTRLARQSLPPRGIVNTVVVLRRMSDFPAVNEVYGTLFPDPSPPARVTISCGGQLPPGVNVAVFLSVHARLGGDARQGLHVQSRSYWAPANIGPYSQAVSVPVSSLSGAGANGEASSDPRVVSVAGQIPLTPATMDLPSGPTAFGSQAVLSLQHLWRIGTEMGVRWWTSAVAYIPRASPSGQGSSASSSQLDKVRLTARAWTTAHQWSIVTGDDADADAADGPDLWDRKFDARYMSFAGEQTGEQPGLPDWGVLDRPDGVDQGHHEAATEGKDGVYSPVPPLFVVEVEELPRSAPVEWHAHVGLAGVGAGSVRYSGALPLSLEPLSAPVRADGDGELSVVGTLHHTVLRSPEGSLVLSVAALDFPAGGGKLAASALQRADDVLLGDDGTLSQLAGCPLGVPLSGDQRIVTEVVFADRGAFASPTEGFDMTSPVMPCASIWDARGNQLAAVMVYKMVLEDVKSGPSLSED